MTDLTRMAFEHLHPVKQQADEGPNHRLRISNGFDRTNADLDEIVQRISAAPLGCCSTALTPATSTPISHALHIRRKTIARWPRLREVWRRVN
jgi:hypothetical protein